MKKIVIDTDILIDYANEFAPWLTDILEAKSSTIRLVLPTIVIAEYFTSITLEDEHEKRVAEETFLLFEKQDLIEDIAKVLGRLLRRKTYFQGAGLADLIIAATAIFLDAPLATRNRKHFAKIPDLRFFDPKKLQF